MFEVVDFVFDTDGVAIVLWRNTTAVLDDVLDNMADFTWVDDGPLIASEFTVVDLSRTVVDNPIIA